MVFHCPEGGETALSSYYQNSDHYLSAQTPGSGGESAVELRRYQRLFELLKLDAGKDTGTICDLGCGKGGWLAWLRRAGFRHLMGIEASTACQQWIQAQGGIDFYDKPMDIPNDCAVHVVTLSHVLEHLYNPALELRSLISQADKETLFFIEVPNAPAILDSPNPWSWLFFEHINHFDECSLWALALSVGLEIVESGFWSFDPNHGAGHECCYLVCRPSDAHVAPFKQSALHSSQWSIQLDKTLADCPLSDAFLNVLDWQRPWALWGFSQYAMLVLGMHDDVRRRIGHLFDLSPAKIGRSVAGVKIQHPDNVASLSSDSLLWLPQSMYVESMQQDLIGRGIELETVIF